jgi:PAS domain S-box-containing protein
MTKNLLADQTHILIVDDSQDFLDMLEGQLRHAGYCVTSSLSGQDALDILHHTSQPNQKAIDLVLLDIMMPDLDGVEVLERMRSDKALADIPVLILTALDGVAEKVRAFDAGANDYLTKPFDSREVIIRVRSLLHQQEAKQALMRANQNILSLQKSGQALLGTLDLPDMLQLILEQLAQVIAYDSASIMLVHADTLEIVANQGFRSEKQLFSYKKLEKMQHVQKILNDHIPEIILDTEKDERWYTLPNSEYIRCWIGVPLVVKGNVIGVLNIDSSEPNFYTESHTGLAMSFANQAALAIENTRLFQETKQKTIELQALRDTTLAITSQTERQPLLKNIIQQAALLLNAKGGGIYEYDPQSKELTAVADFGNVKSIVGNVLHEGEGMAGRLISSDEPFMIVDDYAKWEGRLDQYTKREFNAVLEVPLTWQSERVGILYVDDSLGRGFTAQEANLLGLFADQAAIALANANALDELKTTSDHLDRMVASSFDGIITADTTGKITSFNSMSEKILDCSAAEMIGTSLRDLYANPDEPKMIGKLLRKKNDGKLADYETNLRGKSGQKIPIYLSAIWLLDTEENIIGSAGYFKDMRVMEETERHRQLLLDAIDAVAQAKNLNAGLKSLAQKMGDACSSTFCEILLLSQDKKALIARAAYPVSREKKLKWDPGIGRKIRLFEDEKKSKILNDNKPIVLRKGKNRDDGILKHIEEMIGLQSVLQSILVVPLITDNERLGVCILGELRAWDRTPFTQNEIQVAQSLAAQVAALIGKMNFQELSKQRAEELNTLQRLALAVSSSLDLDKVYSRACQAAVEFYRADHCGLVLFDDNNDQGEVVAEYPPSLMTIGTKIPVKGIPLEEDIISKKKPIVVYDVKNEKKLGELCNILHGEFNIQSSLYAPIIVDGKVIGTLGIDSTEEKRDFSLDVENGKIFAVHVATAIQKARIFKLTRAMVTVSRALTGTRDIQEQMEIVWEFVSKELYAPMFYVGLYDDLRDELEYAIAYDMNQPVNIQSRSLAEKNKWGPSGYVVETGKYLEWYSEKQRQARLKRSNIQSSLVGEACRSSIILPLEAEGHVIGVIALQSDKSKAWNETQSGTFRTLTRLVGVAIQNTRLYQETKAGQKRLEAAYEASKDITSSLDPVETLKAIVGRVRDVMRAWRATVVLIDEGNNPRHLVSDGFEQNLELATTIRKDGVSVQVIQTGEAKFFSSTSAAKDEVHPKILVQGVKAAVCLPLEKEGRNVGVLWVHYAEEHTFKESEKEALRLYAMQAAIAYENALQVKELGHLRDAAEALTSASSTQEILHQIVQSAKEVLQADSAAIWPYDNDRDRFIVEQAVEIGIPVKLWEEFREEEPQRGRMTYTVMEKGWCGVPDVGNDDHPFLSCLGVKSFQGIALAVEGEKLGVLYVNYNIPRWFSKEEKDVANVFANQAATELKKAKLAEQVAKSRKAAITIAKIMTLEKMESTLQSIVSVLMNVTYCDAVTLYSYNQETDSFGYPPTTIGLYDESGVKRFDNVPQDSVLRKILALDFPYIATDAQSDSVIRRKIKRSIPPFVVREEIKSSIAIPLSVGEQKVGVMFVNFRSPRMYKGSELEDITLLANQAAVAIHNAQLYQAEQKHTEALKAIQETSTAVSANLDEILPLITEKAAEIFNVQASSLMLWDASNENLTIQAAFGLGEKYKKDQQITRNVADQIVKEKGFGPHIFNIHEAPIGNQKLVDHEGLHTVLVAPLIISDELTGVLNIYGKEEFRQFTKNEMELAAVFANQAAIAIGNAQLYTEINKRAITLQALYDAGQAITSTLTLDEILNHIVEQAWKLTGSFGSRARFCDLELVDGKVLKRKSAYPPGCFDELQKIVGEISLESEAKIGITGRVAQTGESQLVGDVTKNADYIVFDKKTNSELAVPIKIGEEVIGVINVEHPDCDAFDEEDLRGLESLATQAAVAIQNARQFESLKKIRGLIGSKTATDWIQMVSTVWGHAIIREARIARNYLELTQQDVEDKDLLQAQEDLFKCFDVIDRIKEIPIIAPLSVEDGVNSVRINELLEKYLGRVWEHESYKSISTTFDLQPDLDDIASTRASSEWIRRALEILLDNALQAMDKANSPAKEIEVATRLSGKKIEIYVKDNGPGIPPLIRSDVTHSPIDKPAGSQGAGLGLMLAKNIVQTYGGDLLVRHTGKDGTAMLILLPIEN